MPDEALGLLPGMLRGRFKPNGFTFASLLKAAGASASSGIGEQIHALTVKYDWHDDVYVGSALLDMYARCGRMDMAIAVFDQLESKNGVSWNALIAGFARKGDGETTLLMFAEMQRNGFEATHFTYSSVFSAIAGIGALEQGNTPQKLSPYFTCDHHKHLGSEAQSLFSYRRLSWNERMLLCGPLTTLRHPYTVIKRFDFGQS
ncbi:hypothetical protein OsI_33797 [Oryza sativa Indica Group]|uniref:Pentatricopeptide repeat-containing protein n=1 Tax=Oryza sativa subsp. indica TaxID=39946 RepID=A2Z7W1_ORYSI|nr:hypothetical protein OsI_33797 [Oryza sativa Indica Group]